MVVFTIPTSLFPTIRFIISIAVIEKKDKMKETLKIMSMTTLPYAISYFTT